MTASLLFLAATSNRRRSPILGGALKAALLAAVVSCLGLTTADAATDTIDASTRSWYSETGQRNLTDNSYTVGMGEFTEVRNVLIFTLPNSTESIVSAQLQLWNPPNGYFSADTTETYTLFNVSSSIALLESGVNSTAIFTDLGSGISYGSATVSENSGGTFVSISLNAAFLEQAQALPGGKIAIGGALTSLFGDENEGIFGYTGSSVSSDAQLVINTVPEPSVYGLLGLGVAGLLVGRRLRTSVA